MRLASLFCLLILFSVPSSFVDAQEFTKLIVVAMMLASPIAYYVMQTWLKDFACRIEINWFWFIASAVGALLIALLTVSYQSVKTAMINPAKSLRC